LAPVALRLGAASTVLVSQKKLDSGDKHFDKIEIVEKYVLR